MGNDTPEVRQLSSFIDGPSGVVGDLVRPLTDRIPDPLRRGRVPDDLESITTVRAGAEVDPTEAGMAPDGPERIWRAVERVYRHGVHPAIALCVRRNGKVVLDRAIGHVSGNGPGDPVDGPKVVATPDTPFVLASASKAVTAMLVHLADQRGLLHVDNPVAEYIPEFAAHGKGAITIAHVLSHRAGVPTLRREVLDIDRMMDRDFVLATMCEATPQWRPGRVVAYHAVSGGFVLAEVLQRVTGMSIRDFLGTNVCAPLGMRWGNYGVPAADLDLVARNYATGLPTPPPLSNLFERALGLPLDEVTAVLNDARFLTGVAPSANVVATADDHCRFYELLLTGGEFDGARVFEPTTVRRAIAEKSWIDVDLTLGLPLRYSLGFMLGRRVLSWYGPNTEYVFGHNGFTNILGWADPQRRVSAALLTSGTPVISTHVLDFLAVPREIAHQSPADGLEDSPLYRF